MKNRRNIALFVAMLENEFSYAVCEGALRGAEEADVNLFIFPAGILDAVYDDFDANYYRYQYNILYSFVKSRSIDAIILEYGTLTSFLNAKQKRDFLADMTGKPVILLAGKEEGYSSVCVDNCAGLRAAIRHILRDHQLNRVGFVSGPDTSLDALERLSVFRDTMREEGKPVTDDWIVYGNFSEFCEDAVEKLLLQHPDIQAIVCANDQMAVGCYNVLRKHHLQPGKDVLVTGFDDSPTCLILDPNLTSVRADTAELARRAVVECEKIIEGQILHVDVKSELVLRESCGCVETQEFPEEGADCIGKLSNRMLQNRRVEEEKRKIFEIVLTNITRDMLQSSNSDRKKYDAVISKLRRMEFTSGYLLGYMPLICHEREESWNFPEQLYVRAYYNQDHAYNCEDESMGVSSDELFTSKIMPNDRRHDMLVLPLFSGVEQYGLLLTESGPEHFRYASQIACQVGVSLEVLEIIKKQNAIKDELERNLAQMEENNRVLNIMSHSDPLTGIANRRGFLETVKSILENENNHGKKAAAIYADMDNLKIVNDEFGHDEGDFALKTIAKALQESFRSSDVIARMGGDEFAAFAIVSQDHFDQVIRTRIQGILKELNQNDKPYYVNISIGACEFTIGKDVNLDHILNLADEDLYREKKNKKKVVYKERP